MGVVLLLLVGVGLGILILANRYHKKHIRFYEVLVILAIVGAFLAMQLYVRSGLSGAHYRRDLIENSDWVPDFEIDIAEDEKGQLQNVDKLSSRMPDGPRALSLNFDQLATYDSNMKVGDHIAIVVEPLDDEKQSDWFYLTEATKVLNTSKDSITLTLSNKETNLLLFLVSVDLKHVVHLDGRKKWKNPTVEFEDLESIFNYLVSFAPDEKEKGVKS